MSRNRFALLAAITVAAVLLAVSINIQNQPEPLDPGAPLLPQLEQRINDVTEVRVSSADGDKVTIRKGDAGWVVVERDDWPADFGRVRENLIVLARTRVFEPKTSNPIHYGRLGVEDPGPDSDNSAIAIMAGDNEITTVIIGDTAATTGGSYVRLRESDQALLLHEALRPPVEARRWIDREVINIPQSRIRRVVIDPPVEDAYVVSRDDAGELRLEGKPDNKPLKPGTIRRLTSVLKELRVNDVIAQADEPDDDSEWFRATHETENGVIVVYETRQLGATHYIRMTASYDPARDTTASASEGDSGDKNAAAQSGEAEAARLAARLNGRQFTVPAFRGTDVSQYWDDLYE